MVKFRYMISLGLFDVPTILPVINLRLKTDDRQFDKYARSLK